MIIGNSKGLTPFVRNQTKAGQDKFSLMDRMSRSNDNKCRVYVGNLPQDVRSRDVENLFSKYGKIIDVNVKDGHGGRGPSFAFLEFEDPR